MKRLIALVSLTAALATTGCGHKQLTNAQVAKYSIGVGGFVLLMAASMVANNQPHQ